ncbi:MAG: class I SAM-dependent methyltransferase [Bacteroidetes bacterium]|nr:class I SAM-dependent methyltransferase [Bacteroidota bacterium]
METLEKCPSCGNKNINNTEIKCKDFLVSGEEFVIQRCDDCELLITNPRPTLIESGKYYKSSEYISHTDSKKNLFEKTYGFVKNIMLKRKVKLVKKFFDHREIRLLDYGCGTGDFLVNCKKHKFDVIGIEPDEDARSRARKKQIEVFENQEQLSINNIEKFNAITLWHVIEHIHDLKIVLERLYNAIEENGLLIIAIPEHKSLDARIYKEFWAAYDVPRHLYHFNSKALNNCLSGLKLEYICKKPLFFDSFYVSILSESNKGRGKVMSFLFGSVIGLISNIYAFLKITPYSSQIYIFRKKAL